LSPIGNSVTFPSVFLFLSFSTVIRLILLSMENHDATHAPTTSSVCLFLSVSIMCYTGVAAACVSADAVIAAAVKVKKGKGPQFV